MQPTVYIVGGLQRPLDAYHSSMQSTNFNANTDHRAMPSWGGHGERNMAGNNSGAHVVEVSTPDIQHKDDNGRRPSVPSITGRQNHPTSAIPRSVHDRRRFALVLYVSTPLILLHIYYMYNT